MVSNSYSELRRFDNIKIGDLIHTDNSGHIIRYITDNIIITDNNYIFFITNGMIGIPLNTILAFKSPIIKVSYYDRFEKSTKIYTESIKDFNNHDRLKSNNLNVYECNIQFGTNNVDIIPFSCKFDIEGTLTKDKFKHIICKYLSKYGFNDNDVDNLLIRWFDWLL